MAETENEINERIMAKIDELINVANTLPKLPDFSKAFDYINSVKLLSSDVHYVSIPKTIINAYKTLKKGDYVRVFLIPITNKNVIKNE